MTLIFLNSESKYIKAHHEYKTGEWNRLYWWGSYLDTQPTPAFGGHRFLSLIIIHITDLKGAHPTLPTFRMKVM